MDDLVDYVVILFDIEVYRFMIYGILYFVSFIL